MIKAFSFCGKHNNEPNKRTLKPKESKYSNFFNLRYKARKQLLKSKHICNLTTKTLQSKTFAKAFCKFKAFLINFFSFFQKK